MTTTQPRLPNPPNASFSIPVSLVPRQLAAECVGILVDQGGSLENKVNWSGVESQVDQAPEAEVGQGGHDRSRVNGVRTWQLALTKSR